MPTSASPITDKQTGLDTSTAISTNTTLSVQTEHAFAEKRANEHTNELTQAFTSYTANNAANRFISSLALYWKKWPVLLSLMLSLFAGLIVEGLVFNYSYFTFDEDKYVLKEIKLPFNEQLQRNAFIFTQENKQLTISGIDYPVNRIYLEFWGNREQVTGRIYIRDHSSSRQSFSANNFIVEPSNPDLNHVNKLILATSPLHACTVAIEEMQAPNLVLSRLAFNVPVAYKFNLIRFLGITILLWLSITVFRTRFYTKDLNWQNKSHKIIQGSLLMFCYVLALCQLAVLHPANTNPIFFKFLEYGAVALGNKSGSLWLDFPQNSLELENHDPFVQQLEAYLDGRLHLNLREDPKLASLEHPYDRSLRAAEKANSQWDHSYYKNKFYSYYAPSLVAWLYAPLYLLTGHVPLPVLAEFILIMLVITAVFWVMPVLNRVWNLRSNALLFFVSELVMVCGSMLYYLQASINFYAMPILNNILLGLIMIGCSYRALITKSSIWCQVLLGIVGLMIVAIVLSRVTGLLICLTLILPAIYQFFFAPEIRQNKVLFKQHFLKSLWGIGIVILGAVGVMCFNYQRFDSVFEFGQRYCTSWIDVTTQYINAAEFRLINFSNSFYHGFIEGYIINKDFPFITSNTATEANYGANLIKISNFGIWSVPNQILLLLWLICWFKQTSSAQAMPSEYLDASEHNSLSISHISYHLWQCLRYSFVLSIGSFILTGYLNFSFGSPCSRYSIELLFFSNILVCLLMLNFIKFIKENNPAHDASSQSLTSNHTLYWIVLSLSLYTIMLGFLITFELYQKGEIAGDLNPDVMPYLKNMFEPLTGI